MDATTKPLVLIVDDEEAFLEIVSLRLEAAGFRVIPTHSVVDAIEKAREFLPDIILSDISMPPGADGWELASELRHDEKMRDIKFAFFTSQPDPLSELRGDRKVVAIGLGPIKSFDKSADAATIGDRVWDILKT
jgi:CheY-like chemotaxis protein